MRARSPRRGGFTAATCRRRWDATRGRSWRARRPPRLNGEPRIAGVAAPPTRYARSGEVQIAYQTLGEGPPDVVFIGGPASHLDLQWDDPSLARTMQRYASFCRLIRFDRRGTG